MMFLLGIFFGIWFVIGMRDFMGNVLPKDGFELFKAGPFFWGQSLWKVIKKSNMF